MSYCAGWKHNGSVYLLADAVAARSITPRRDQISLGELLTEYRDDPVEEPSLKLIRIAPGTVVACTGEVEHAVRVLDFLREHQQGSASNIELLCALDSRFGPFSPDSSLALLVASSSHDGSTELLRWTASGGLDQTGSDLQLIGGTTPYHAALSPELLAVLAAGDLTSDRLLAVITAIVQSHGGRGASIDQSVDGLVFGLRTGGGSIAWQADTLVVFYDQDFASGAHVAVLARDDELVLHSSENNVTRVFSPLVSTSNGGLKGSVWMRGIRTELASNRFRYSVFISTSEKMITLIVRDDFDRESRYVRSSFKSNGRFDLAFSPELTALLLSPMHEKNRDIPLRLSVRED